MKKRIVKIGPNQVTLTCYIQYEASNPTPDRPALLVFPGGAYYFTFEPERDPVTYPFLDAGYNVYLLDYSTTVTEMMQKDSSVDFNQAREQVVEMILNHPHPISTFPAPLIDAALAIQYIREHSKEDHTNPDQVVTLGFSAGGNLAALLGSYWNVPWLKEAVGAKGNDLKPNAQLLSYAFLDTKGFIAHTSDESHPKRDTYLAIAKAMFNTTSPTAEQLRQASPIDLISRDVPRTFLWHTKEDATVPVQQALNYALALQNLDVPWELHIYEKGRHGLSVASSASGEVNQHVRSWIKLSLEWLGYTQ